MSAFKYWEKYDAKEPPPRTSSRHVRFVVISDTHSTEPEDVPDGNILLHSGDLTKLGSDEEVRKQIDWLASLPHEHKIIIAGNHDFALDNSDGWYDRRGVRIHAKYGYPPSDTAAALRYVREKRQQDTGTLHYLENEAVEVSLQRSGDELRGRKWKVWGSPASPMFGNWAWNYERGQEAKAIYSSIPSDADILLTHGPPYQLGSLDQIHDGNHVGCQELTRKARDGEIRPLIWACGHIHEARGVHEEKWGAPPGQSGGSGATSTLVVNSAMVAFDLASATEDHSEDIVYRVVHQPVIVDVPVDYGVRSGHESAL